MKTAVVRGLVLACAWLGGPALWACASNGAGPQAGDASDEGTLEASAESGAGVDGSPDADATATDARAQDADADAVTRDASSVLDASDGSDSDWDGACVEPDAPVGLPMDPGYVSCVNQDFSVADGGACCTGNAGGGWYSFWSASGTCGENTFLSYTLRRGCDEPADCPAGEVCCLSFVSPTTTSYGFLEYTCSATCPPADAGGSGYAVCKSQSDCPGDAGPCVSQDCDSVYAPTRQTQTCGGILPLTGDFSCSMPMNNEHVCAVDGGSSVPEGGGSVPEGGSVSEGGSSVSEGGGS
jgi:hypothetical protein